MTLFSYRNFFTLAIATIGFSLSYSTHAELVFHFDPTDTRTTFVNGYEDNRFGTVPATELGDLVGWFMDARVPSTPTPDPDNGQDGYLDAQQGVDTRKASLGWHPSGNVLDFSTSDISNLLFFDSSVSLADGLGGALDGNTSTVLVSARLKTSGTGSSYLIDFRDSGVNEGISLRYNYDSGELEGLIKQQVAVSLPVAAGDWFAASLAWNGASSSATLTVDALSGTTSASGSASSDTVDIDRGRLGSLSSIANSLNGKLGAVMVYNDVDDHSSELSAIANDFAVAIPELIVDRETGNISITVPSGSVSLTNIAGYTITSEAGTLDPTQWLSIANNYDAGSPGTNQVDPDNNWTVLSNSALRTDLSELEFEQSGGANNGADFVAGKSTDLGNAWIKYYEEDLDIQLVLDDGSLLPLDIHFTGNDGALFEYGDLNFDGDINADDFFDVFVPNYGADTSSLVSGAERYGLGDMDENGAISLEDFVTFNNVYMAANPGAAALSFNSVSVPEPGSLAMLTLAGCVALLMRHKAIVMKMATFAAVAFLFATSSAYATIGGVLEVDFESLTVGSTISDATRIQDVSGNRYHGFWGGGSGANNTPVEAVYFEGPVYVNNEENTGYVILRDGLADSSTPNDWWGTEATPSPYFTLGAETSYTFEAVLNWNGDDQAIDGIMGQTGTTEWWIREQNGYLEYVFDDGPNRVQNTGTIVLGEAINDVDWHHIGITFARNASDPTQVSITSYLDYQPIYTEAVAVSMGEIGDGTADIRLGSYNTSSSSRFDGWMEHFRISDEVLDVEDFLETPVVPEAMLTVNTVTGLVTLTNNSGIDLAMDAYRLTSDNDTLNPSGWTSLDSKNLDGVGAWTELGSTTAELSEGFLGGSSIIASPATISFGTVYAGMGSEDATLTFEYHSPGDSVFRDIEIVFVDDPGLQGDFNNDGIVDQADYTLWRNNLGNADESAIGSNGDGANGVDVADYQIWKANFGLSIPGSLATQTSQAVPEPASAMLALIGVVLVLGSRNRWHRYLVGSFAMFATLLACVGSASATTNDRLYSFGDPGTTDPTFGASVGEGSPMGFFYNSATITGDDASVDSLSGSYQDLIVNGTTYTSAATRPGAASDSWAANFNGSASLATPYSLNAPAQFWDNLTFFASGEFPYNYEGIYSHGIATWVKPNVAALSAGNRQDLVIDTTENGIYITDAGTWGLQFDGGGDSGVSVASTLDSNGWAHVMQLGGLLDLEGGSSAYQGALYVNGIAVMVTSTGQAYDQNSDALSVGSNQAEDGNFYTGAMDDLAIFLWGDNSDQLGADEAVGGTNGIGGLNADGRDWGSFSLLEDNEYIQLQLDGLGISTLKAGDVDLDGVVDLDDITAFQGYWGQINEVNNIVIGDWGTRQQGDLNLDGKTDIYDAILLRQELGSAGFAGLSLGSIVGGGTAVPEPTSAVALLLLAGLGLVGRRTVTHRN